MQAVRGPRAGRSCLLPAAAEALAGPPSLHKVFGRSGTPCRPLLFKGRCQDPPQPKRLPLAQHRPCRSCSSRLRATDRPVAVTPSVVALLTPATRCCRLPADLLAGVRRFLLARARPSASVRDRHAPCTHGLLLASLRGHSTAEDVGCSFPCRSASNRPAHAPRGRAAKPIASTSCIDPPRRQGIAPSLLGHLAPRAATPAVVAQGPAAAAVTRALARLWSFLPLPALVVPRKAGAKKCTPVHRRSVVP